jgi:hypothetical protein
MRLKRKDVQLVLDFDVEARPLSWYGGDWVSKELTAIAWAWVAVGKPRRTRGPVTAVLLGDDAETVGDLLDAFRPEYDAADIVTGHYVRGFDLPLLNAAALELGQAPLGSTLVQDTKTDLVRLHGLSKSQESLGATLGLKRPKISMTQDDWREANRLTPAGIERTRRRVVGDVRQHVELRAALLERGMLRAPSSWTGTAYVESYHP